MAFDWKEYFELASDWVEETNEAYYRSSVSRAYYSVFNVLLQNVKITEKVDKHKKLIEILKDEFLHHLIEFEIETAELVLIGNEMEWLRNKRNEADYNSRIKIDKKIAIEAIEKIKNIFAIIN